MISSVSSHQQSSVPVLGSLARHTQRQKYLLDPTMRRWPLSLARHDSLSITGGLVMDGQLLKENFFHRVYGRRHRGCPGCSLAHCQGKPQVLELRCGGVAGKKVAACEPGNRRRVVARIRVLVGFEIFILKAFFSCFSPHFTISVEYKQWLILIILFMLCNQLPRIPKRNHYHCVVSLLLLGRSQRCECSVSASCLAFTQVHSLYI